RRAMQELARRGARGVFVAFAAPAGADGTANITATTRPPVNSRRIGSLEPTSQRTRVAAMPTIEIETPTGSARAHLHPAKIPEGALVLGHGAGGGVEAPDLIAARDAAVGAGFSVALVEQPYRVAGRRAPAPARRLDEAWIAALEHLRGADLKGLQL